MVTFSRHGGFYMHHNEIGKILQGGQTEPKLYVYTTMVKFVRSEKVQIHWKYYIKCNISYIMVTVKSPYFINLIFLSLLPFHTMEDFYISFTVKVTLEYNRRRNCVHYLFSVLTFCPRHMKYSVGTDSSKPFVP